jgi:hypothetical protein
MSMYYYLQGKSVQGPFTMHEMETQKLTAKTMVWFEGMAEWKMLKDVPALKILISSTAEASDSRSVTASANLPYPDLPKTYQADDNSLSGLAKRYRWILVWMAFHLLAFLLSVSQVPFFNNEGKPKTEKFWPFVKYTETSYAMIKRVPEEWETVTVFNGIFVNYDWTECFFYIFSVIFILLVRHVYHRDN